MLPWGSQQRSHRHRVPTPPSQGCCLIHACQRVLLLALVRGKQHRSDTFSPRKGKKAVRDLSGTVVSSIYARELV